MNDTTRTRPKRRFWTRGRLFLTFASLALFALAASNCNPSPEVGSGVSTPAPEASRPAGTGPAARSSASPATPKAAGEALPDAALNTEIRMLDGKTMRLSDYAGKVVVLDLWATWCGPCREEVPHLVELYNEFKSRGVEVIGLTTEDPETDEDLVREFAREFNINYELGWAQMDFALALTRGRDAIPQTFVIGRDGRLYKHLVGFSPQSSPAKLREALEQAVNAQYGV